MTNVLEQPLVPGTTEWARYITASKVSAIIGLSPYDSPLSCWHKMKGNIPLEGETEDHRRGHYAEPAIIAWWCDQHPEYLGVRTQPQYVREDLPWAAATPDAIALSDVTAGIDDALVEAKTARSMDDWGLPGTDEIPAYYFVQVMWQLHISGLRRAFVPVWGSWFEMEEYVVDYDEEIALGLEARCREFWDSLQADEPPPLDDTLATFQTLKALHPLINDDEVAQLGADIAVEFIDATVDFKTAEDRKRAAQSAVLAAMGNAQYGNHGDVRVARRQPGKGDSVSLYKVAKTSAAITDQENQS